MTAQRKNIFIFNENNFDIVSVSNSFGVKPTDFGITPQYIETGCWDGYWNEYGLQGKQLVLKTIFVNSSRNRYPKIAGKKPLRFYRQDGYHKYKNLDMELNYSGQILIAKNFLWEHRYDLYCVEPWEYEVLTKLTFKNGILTDVIDCNAVAQQTRQFLVDNPEERHMFFRHEFLEKLYDSG